jgi:3-hydroxyisobutyrate dehydrogenase
MEYFTILFENSRFTSRLALLRSSNLAANTLLGLSRKALAEALVLDEKAGLEHEQLISVLKQTALVSPCQKVALENAEQRKYPAKFPLPLMFKDFDSILHRVSRLTAPSPR